jgi:hypothetical protein
MTDDDVRDLFHRVELRLERLDTKVEGLEKRLARKADTWVVTVGMGGLGLLLTIYKFFV